MNTNALDKELPQPVVSTETSFHDEEVGSMGIPYDYAKTGREMLKFFVPRFIGPVAVALAAADIIGKI